MLLPSGKLEWLRYSTRPLRRRTRRALLVFRARLKRRFVDAEVIAVTGSSGKTSTTLLISKLMETAYRTRTLVFENTIEECAKSILAARGDEECLVTEVAAYANGTVASSARIVRPDIAVVTFVGIEHRSKFKTKDRVALEKGALVEAVADGGFAVLNADDEHVMQMASRTKQRIVTFGMEQAADYRVVELNQAFPDPLMLTIASRHGKHQIASRLVGTHNWANIAAAYAVAMEKGIGVETIKSVLAEFEPVINRCMPYPIADGPTMILDTYKAPRETLQAAFSVLAKARASRKRLALGTIGDYAGKASKTYASVYRQARDAADKVIFIGEHAHRHGASQADIDDGRIVEAHSAKELHQHLRETAEPGEVILIKGAASNHLERAALAFTHDVRCWKDKCGKIITCQDCGLYEFPFTQHEQIIASRKRARAGRRVASLFRRRPA